MAEEKKRGAFDWYFKTNLLVRILIGLVLGAIVGIILGFFPDSVKPFVDNTKFFGDLFIRLLKMIVVPVILFSLITGAASIAPSRLGRVGVKIMVYYLLTSAFAVLIGLVLPIFPARRRVQCRGGCSGEGRSGRTANHRADSAQHRAHQSI